MNSISKNLTSDALKIWNLSPRVTKDRKWKGFYSQDAHIWSVNDFATLNHKKSCLQSWHLSPSPVLKNLWSVKQRQDCSSAETIHACSRENSWCSDEYDTWARPRDTLFTVDICSVSFFTLQHTDLSWGSSQPPTVKPAISDQNHLCCASYIFST